MATSGYSSNRMRMHRIVFIAMASCLGACDRHESGPVLAPTVSGVAKGDLKSEKEASLIAQICLMQFSDGDLHSLTGLWPLSEATSHTSEQYVRTDLVFLAMGRNSSGKWISPEQATIETIGSEKIASVAEAGIDDMVLSLENLSWQGDYLVLDISTYHRRLGTHGTLEAEFVFEDEKWKLSSVGGCYVLPPEDG